MDTHGGAQGRAGAFAFHSRPHCSLTGAQSRATFWSLAVVCFGVAIGFAVQGYWLVLPFAGLEIGLLAWALETLRERENNYEILTIDGDVVILEWRNGKQSGRRELNRRWLQVQCECLSPGRSCHLSVKSHGRETVVGQYLSDEARMRLAVTLRKQLQG
ncbi:MAG: DUF2244 domain-containing protein [Thiobacillus sp.]|nr:DUF2244 domain-containing protein [Thiobacillus sp.]